MKINFFSTHEETAKLFPHEQAKISNVHTQSADCTCCSAADQDRYYCVNGIDGVLSQPTIKQDCKEVKSECSGKRQVWGPTSCRCQQLSGQHTGQLSWWLGFKTPVIIDQMMQNCFPMSRQKLATSTHSQLIVHAVLQQTRWVFLCQWYRWRTINIHHSINRIYIGKVYCKSCGKLCKTNSELKTHMKRFMKSTTVNIADMFP